MAASITRVKLTLQVELEQREACAALPCRWASPKLGKLKRYINGEHSVASSATPHHYIAAIHNPIPTHPLHTQKKTQHFVAGGQGGALRGGLVNSRKVVSIWTRRTMWRWLFMSISVSCHWWIHFAACSCQ